MKNDKNNLLQEVFKSKKGLLAYAFSYVKNWQTAEDVVQESFVIISERWEDYHPGKSVFCWARGIVRIRCFDAIRRLEREKPTERDRLDDYIESTLEDAWDDSANYQLEEQIRLLRDCVVDLPELSKQLILEFYLHGNSYEKISNIIGKSVSFVADNLFRLRKKLRRCIDSKISEAPIQNDDNPVNPEFFDDIYYGKPSPEEREIIVNCLQSNTDSGLSLLSFLIEHTALAIVAIQWQSTSKNKRQCEDQLLAHEAEPAAFDVISNPERSNKRKLTFFSSTWQVLAACLLLCAALSWWIAGKTGKSEIARIVAVEGEASILRRGLDHSKADKGIIINIEDKIMTGNKGSLSLTLLREDSGMKLVENTHFLIGHNHKANHFLLQQGEIIANVGRQRPDAPMVISTEYTEAIVLGTRFKLKRTPQSVLLHVIEGRVQFTNKTSGQSVVAKTNESYSINKGEGSINPVSAGNRGNDGIATIPPNGLIGMYHFDDGTGNTFSDSSTLRTRGRLPQGAQPDKIWVNGKNGSAVNFASGNEQEGSNLTVDNFPIDDISDGLSVFLWIKKESDTSTKQSHNQLVSARDKRQDFKVGTNGWYMGLRSAPGGEFKTSFVINRRGNGLGATSNKFSLTANEWTLLGITFNSGQVSFYLNAELVGTSEFIDSKIIPASVPQLRIGPSLHSLGFALDELSIHNRSLELHEIQSLFRNE